MNEQQLLSGSEETIDCWAYVEIFGHNQVAGRISSRKFGTQIMFQIDVPKSDEGLSHTELYSPNSIFSIKPTTEEWCRRFTKMQSAMNHNVLPYIPEARQLAEPAERKENSLFEDLE